MSTIECEFELEYDNEKHAEIIKESLEPDNQDYIDLKQERNKLYAICKGKTPMELLHTVDDFLACLSIAEDALNKL